ncbi:unnamed protein product [Effrenium voratum]|uniref:Enoyl reductase (ER) domain-containing protein n=1 Tax=Effrenium voratum TaxID=2562239 RepID=A0AA36JEU9_9DINO|nr:unnamed protein product [Effrenium voratum]CAJ1429821.1 unnamed protein product [Effrenium voratum]
MRISAVVAEAFGGPEVLQLSSKELSPLQSGQVRVKVEAAGVNPSDTYLRLGVHGPYAAVPHLLPNLPWTPGKDGAGVVEEVAPDVTHLKVGQRVYTCAGGTGTYASHANLDAAGVFPLPDGITFAEGACVGVPCATAYYALRFRAQAAGRVFVHGASGAVGLAAVMLAKDLGCFVVGTAGTSAGLQAIASAGADVAICHREEGYIAKCQTAAPEGFDVILEMAAHANLPADLQLAGPKCRLCIVGSKAEPVAVNPRLLMPKEIDMKGVFLGSASASELKDTHAALYDAMERRALVPVVAQQLPLSEAGKAHVEVMAPSAGGAAGNVVLVPGMDSCL